jgi:hypothetical protein
MCRGAKFANFEILWHFYCKNFNKAPFTQAICKKQGLGSQLASFWGLASWPPSQKGLPAWLSRLASPFGTASLFTNHGSKWILSKIIKPW